MVAYFDLLFLFIFGRGSETVLEALVYSLLTCVRTRWPLLFSKSCMCVILDLLLSVLLFFRI